MADAANHIFLPWVQSGAAANIPDQATDTLGPDQPAIISLPVKLVVNTSTVEKTARLFGPGDVTGIDPQQVVRLEPKPGVTDFEPNYFPAVEFDRPDFPWLLTPAKANGQARLRPWLCLVVVRKQPGVELRPPENQALAVLEIKAPAIPGVELPDLSESHFWAHAQVSAAAQAELKTILESAPARTVSRLVCPRRLDPATDYLACVVPAFEVGRQTGLGEATTEDKLKPAWLSGSESPAEITLPVYYFWGVRTGAGGDFEELVRRLKPRELPAEVGKRPMDIAQPGFPMQPEPAADAPGTTLGLEGALRVVDTKSDPWPDEVRLPFQTALQRILNTPWEIATKGSDEDPIVAPPVYGCWQAGAHEVAVDNTNAPPWLNELNLDPRNRAVAAMGTQVIQQQQEALMASAWEQLGDLEKINQRLRQAQLSRAVNDRYHVKTFARLPPESLIRVIAPSQSRLMVQGAQPSQPETRMLLSRMIAESPVPAAAVSAPLRKLARPRGAINRQYRETGITAGFFSRVMIAPPITADQDPVTVDKVSSGISFGSVTVRDHRTNTESQEAVIWNPDPPAHWERPSAALMQMLVTFRLGSLSGDVMAAHPVPPESHAFFEAASAHQAHLTRLFAATGFQTFRVALPLPTVDLKAAVMVSLSPAMAVSQAALGGLSIASPSSPTGDELEPIMDAPSFPQPMYAALRDLSQDYLFPGLEHVPSNTVQLLQTNAKFIESFMVGLNSEMSRELLWRDYPTDQRGTYFRQFWDTAAAGAQSQLDITPIHQWGRSELGATAVGAEGDKLVLLIRGELLRRYPGTVIYGVKAARQPDGRRGLATEVDENGNPPEVWPVFRGTLEPDVVFVGFALTRAEVLDGEGYFFVLQEQPTEPRFGLDEDPFEEGGTGKIPLLRNWNDLNWGHLAPSLEKLKQLSHVSVKSVQLFPAENVKGNWGRNSAHMALITRQLPVRVAIHATELLS